MFVFVLIVLGCGWENDVAYAIRITNLKLLTRAKVVAVENNQENYLTIVFSFKKDDVDSFVLANKENGIDCNQVTLTEALFDKKYENKLNKCNSCFIATNKLWWAKMNKNTGFLFLEIWYE